MIDTPWCPVCGWPFFSFLTQENYMCAGGLMGECAVAPVGDADHFQHKGYAGIRPAVAFAWLRLGWQARIMEVGTQFGENAARTMDLMRPSRMVCVDPYIYIKRGSEEYFPETYDIAKKRLESYKCCELIRGASQDVLPTMPENTFDFIYIDGDHSPETCSIDIRNALRLVREGGVVGGHDYGLPPQIVKPVDGFGDVLAAVGNVFNGYFVDAHGSDWWVVVIPELKRLGT